MKRGCCEFGTCCCVVFITSKTPLCKSCNHGKIWHKLLYNNLYYNQFKSSRKYAQKPEYTTVDKKYCDSIDNLPA